MSPLPLVAAAVLSTAALAPADDPKPADPPKSSGKSDEIVITSHVGNVVGEVVKVGSESITVKVPEVVQTGTTRQHVGGGGRAGHTVTVPKLGTKLVEVTYPLADKVVVKTVGGKDADLSAVKEGEAVELHLDKVREGKVGEKLESHLEVKRIDVPNPPASKK